MTELEESRRAAAELWRLQQAAAALPELEAQAEADARYNRAVAEREAAEAAAGQELTRARDALSGWRAEYSDWLRAGWALVGRLHAIEDPLLPALERACNTAMLFAPPSEPGGEQARALRAVNGELKRLGGYAPELEPFPDLSGADEWTKLQVDTLLRFFRELYRPERGASIIMRPRNRLGGLAHG